MADSNIASEVARLEKKLDELEGMRSRSKWLARAMMIVILLVAFTAIYAVGRPVIDLVQDEQAQARLVQMIQQDAQQQLTPVIEREMQTFMGQIEPIIKQELPRVLEQQYPRLAERLESEFNTLVVNVEDHTRGRFVEMQQDILDQHERQLLAEIPELSREGMPNTIDDEKLTLVVQRAGEVIERVATRLVENLFYEHYGAITELETTFNLIEVPEYIRAMSNDELGKHVTGLVGELLTAKFDLDQELELSN